MSIYSSREPFNDDPEPYRNTLRGGRQGVRYGLGLEKFDPRPEYTRPQNNPTNPILSDYRLDIAHTTWKDRDPREWLDEVLSDPVWLNGPPWTLSEIDHARKVLTRLAALEKEES